jgi:hypothetical protein
MAILKGKDILDRVRRKTKNESYGSFDEINEAQMLIAEKSSFWWLRKSNIVGAGLEASTKEYDLNLSDVQTIENIWVAASSTTSVGDIEGITLSGSNPVSIQITAHGLTTGRQILPTDTVGTTEINDNIYRVTVTDVDNFTLDGTDSSNFIAWSSGGSIVKYDINDGTWELMTEAPSQLFESDVRNNTDEVWTVTSGVVTVSTTSADSSRSDVKWSYYLKGGDAPFGKFVVSPTPSAAYKIKVDYIRLPVEITEEIKPDIPTAYHTLLIDWASGIILMDEEDEKGKIAKGKRLIEKSKSRLLKLVMNSAANRAGAVDRPSIPWIY